MAFLPYTSVVIWCLKSPALKISHLKPTIVDLGNAAGKPETTAKILIFLRDNSKQGSPSLG